jgi:hypothetical protein
MIINILLPADLIRAALCAVDPKELRPALRGVFIDARGYIVATNGAVAFAGKVRGELPGVCDLIIPYDVLLTATKAKGKLIGLERDANGLWWLDHGSRTHFVPIDAQYPDWQRVIPQAPEDETPASYTPKDVTALGKMSAALGSKHFRICQSGETPAQVIFPDGRDHARKDCVAVIMPLVRPVAGAFDRAAFLGQYDVAK